MASFEAAARLAAESKWEAKVLHTWINHRLKWININLAKATQNLLTCLCFLHRRLAHSSFVIISSFGLAICECNLCFFLLESTLGTPRFMFIIFVFLNKEVLRKTRYHKLRRKEDSHTCKYHCHGVIETSNVSKEIKNLRRTSHVYCLVVIKLDS